MMDNDSMIQQIQNILLLQQGGNLDNSQNSTGSQQAAPQQTFSAFGNQGMLQQFMSQQQQRNNGICLPQSFLSIGALTNPNQCLSSQMQQSGMDQFPVEGLPIPFMQQSRNQPNAYAPSTLSSSSLETVSVNSLGSISIGSLSRLFSMGTIGSGGNISNHLPHNMSGNRRVNGFHRQSQTNAGIQNETWASVPPPKKADSYAENGILGPWSAASAALLGDLAISNEEKQKKNKKKPKDRPKRPLSAYNIFFKEERARILEEVVQSRVPNGKIGFQNLAKMIGKRWQELDPESMQSYKEKAEVDMVRYREAMFTYVATQEQQE